MNLGEYVRKAICFLARNFYTLKYVALVLAFCINFVLLFYKVFAIIIHYVNFCAVVFTMDYCNECFGRLRTLLTETLKTKLAEKLAEKLVVRPRLKEVED